MILEIIAGVYCSLCVIGFFYFLFNKNYRKAKPIEHYTEIRDKIVKKRHKVENATETVLSGLPIMQIAIGLVGIGIVLMVGVMVINQVKSTIVDTANITGLEEPIQRINNAWGLITVGIVVLTAFGIIRIFMIGGDNI